MIKITVLEPPYLSAVSYWRLFRPLQVMRYLYPGTFDVVFKGPKEEMNYADAAFTDVVINVRPGRHKHYTEYVEACAGLGKVIIGDLDDDTNDMPMNHTAALDYERQNKRDPITGKTIFDKHFELTRHWWYSTPYLLNKYGKGEVIPNAVLPSELPPKPCPDRGWVAWRGREAQVHDLAITGQAHYNSIRDAFSAMWFIGYLPPLDHGENVCILPPDGDLTSRFDRAKETGHKPVILMPPIPNVEMYMKEVRKIGFNAFWKPLNPCGFNDAKSNIAWIEATMAGGVCITNYAGRPGWEFATDKPLPYDAACEVWRQSCEHIHANFNLVKTAQQRADCIFRLLGLNDAANDQK